MVVTIQLILNFFNAVWNRSIEVVQQPLIDKNMLWILVPLLFTLVLMEFYFDRYKKEQLGWNSAVSNSIVLFFVGFNLLGWLYQNNLLILLTSALDVKIATIKSFIAIIIVLESLMLMLLNFFHLLKGKFAFEISSPLVLNYIGVISVIIVYSSVTLDYITFLSVIFIFILLVIFFKILKLFVPSAEKEIPEKEIKLARKAEYGRY